MLSVSGCWCCVCTLVCVPLSLFVHVLWLPFHPPCLCASRKASSVLLSAPLCLVASLRFFKEDKSRARERHIAPISGRLPPCTVKEGGSTNSVFSEIVSPNRTRLCVSVFFLCGLWSSSCCPSDSVVLCILFRIVLELQAHMLMSTGVVAPGFERKARERHRAATH